MNILPLVDFTISLTCIQTSLYNNTTAYLLTHSTVPLSKCAGGWGKGEGNEYRKGREKGKVICNKIRNQNKLKRQCQMDTLKKHNMQPSPRQWYILFYGRTFN